MKQKLIIGLVAIFLTTAYFVGKQQGRLLAIHQIEVQQNISALTPKAGDLVRHKLRNECHGVILWVNGSVAAVRFNRPTWFGLSSEDVLFTDSQLSEWECILTAE